MPDRFATLADAPVGRALGRRSHRERHDPVAVLAAVRRGVAGPGRIGEAGEARLRVPSAPQPARS